MANENLIRPTTENDSQLAVFPPQIRAFPELNDQLATDKRWLGKAELSLQPFATLQKVKRP